MNVAANASTGDALAVSVSRRLDVIVLVTIALFVAVTKAPVLSTPYYWDEVLWIGFAHKLAERPLWEVLPGLHPLFLFGNRPPGLFAPMAAIFKVTGFSIWLSHAYTACFAVAGAFFTYRLGRLWFGSLAGVVAAALLVADPMYFTQSAMFLSDLPSAAAAVAAVYFGMSRRFRAYWPCAFYLLTLKEPAMAIVAAFSAWAFLVRVRTSVRDAVMDGMRYAAPLAVIALYYAWQWAATGYPFVHYTYAFTPASADLGAAMRKLPWLHGWLLIESGRWMFSLLIAAALTVETFRRRSELLLVALILVAAGYSYAFIYFLPRYLLPIAPFFYVVVAGALTALLRDPRLQVAGAATVALVAHLAGQPQYGTREWSMGYLPIVRMHQQAGALIDRELRGRKVRAGFPFSWILHHPELGYVTAPVDVVPYRRDTTNMDRPADVIVVAEPGDDEALEEYAREQNLEQIAHFTAGKAYVTIYAEHVAVTRAW